MNKLKYADKKEAKQYKGKEFDQLGMSWLRGDLIGIDKPMIFINTRDTDLLYEVMDVLVHELIHIRFPEQQHGLKFHQLCNDIMMGQIF